MPKKIRRVVTGHNDEGKSMIISDDRSPHVLVLPGVEDFALTNLWVTDGSPADNAGRADAASRPVVLEPPPGGTIFRIVEFPPDKGLGKHFDRKAVFGPATVYSGKAVQRVSPLIFLAAGARQAGRHAERVHDRAADYRGVG